MSRQDAPRQVDLAVTAQAGVQARPNSPHAGITLDALATDGGPDPADDKIVVDTADPAAFDVLLVG